MMKYAAEPRLTLGDLEKTVSLRDVEGALEGLLEKELRSRIPAIIEHWTDDDGVHWSPLLDDLRELPQEVGDALLLELAQKAS